MVPEEPPKQLPVLPEIKPLPPRPSNNNKTSKPIQSAPQNVPSPRAEASLPPYASFSPPPNVNNNNQINTNKVANSLPNPPSKLPPLPSDPPPQLPIKLEKSLPPLPSKEPLPAYLQPKPQPQIPKTTNAPQSNTEIMQACFQNTDQTDLSQEEEEEEDPSTLPDDKVISLREKNLISFQICFHSLIFSQTFLFRFFG